MTSFLLSFALLAQAQLGSGVVSGILRDSGGKPVPNVRVALAEASDAISQRPGSVLVSLATTDATGAYRLENVPAGRYFIVSGRVDTPNYYPGTPDPASAKVILISSSGVMAGMDFVIAPESLRSSARPTKDLPLVGGNVLDLIRLLPGISQGSNQPLTFSFDSVNGRIMNFKAADGSPLRFDCFGATIAQPPRDCTFHVSGGGIVDANSFPQDVPGVRFRFKDGGQELEFTCQSAQCKVESSTPAAVSRVLKVRESNVIPTSSPATFTVSP